MTIQMKFSKKRTYNLFRLRLLLRGLSFMQHHTTILQIIKGCTPQTRICHQYTVPLCNQHVCFVCVCVHTCSNLEVIDLPFKWLKDCFLNLSTVCQ